MDHMIQRQQWQPNKSQLDLVLSTLCIFIHQCSRSHSEKVVELLYHPGKLISSLYCLGFTLSCILKEPFYVQKNFRWGLGEEARVRTKRITKRLTKLKPEVVRNGAEGCMEV